MFTSTRAMLAGSQTNQEVKEFGLRIDSARVGETALRVRVLIPL